MEVKGSNGTANYHSSNEGDGYHVVEEKLYKGDERMRLTDLSDLDIRTLSNIKFIDGDLQFVEAVVRRLQEHGIYLWTLGNGYKEWFFKVLKSTTTAEEYATMRTTYARAQPGPVKIDKKGYPSRRVGVSYANIGMTNCGLWNAYPASYSGGNRLNRPAKYCDRGTVHEAPDGTSWRVECPEEERKPVCKWKVMPNQQTRSGYGSTGYEKVEEVGSVPRGDVVEQVGSVPRGDVQVEQVGSSGNPQPFRPYLDGRLELDEIEEAALHDRRNTRREDAEPPVRRADLASSSNAFPMLPPPSPLTIEDFLEVEDPHEDLMSDGDGDDESGVDRLESEEDTNTIAGRNRVRNRNRITLQREKKAGLQRERASANSATRVHRTKTALVPKNKTYYLRWIQ